MLSAATVRYDNGGNQMAKNKGKKNRLAFPVGIIAGILAIVGLITTVNFAIDTVKKFTDKTFEKAEYEKMLEPVVMFDPDPFDDLTQADVSQLLNCAVWNLLMSEESDSKYSYSQGSVFGLEVPQSDIEASFNKLFGNEIDIASLHSSIDMSEYEITYNAASQSYILPITGVESAYTPKVYEIENQGSSKILSVGYINNLAWAQIEGDELAAPEPDKYMKITLRESSEKELYVASIQAVGVQEVVGTTQPEREPVTESAEETTTVPEITEMTTGEVMTDENGEVITTEPATDENGEVITTEPLTDENGEAVTAEHATDENGETVTAEKTTQEITEE